MKISNKISLSFLITVVILTGIAAPIFYLMAKNSITDAIYAHLVTTAHSRAHHKEDEDEIVARNLGVVGYVKKTPQMEGLIEKIREVLT